MNHKKLMLLAFSSFLLLVNRTSLFSQGFTVNGTVTDESNLPVSDVLVTFVNESDTTIVFENRTNFLGEYQIVINPDTDVEDKSPEAVPVDFKLYQNFPNPLYQNTTIPFELNKSGHVRLFIYNIVGQLVRVLLDEYQSKGIHQINWNGLDKNGNRLPSGIYICHMNVMGKIRSKKMLLVESRFLGSVKTGAASHFKRILSKTTSGQYYSVSLTGSKIKPYQQAGILIDRDIQLNFVVKKHNTGTVTDIDGNTYRTVKIGNQWWMAENLKVIHYSNGDPLPNLSNYSEWKDLTTGAYCEFDNDPSYVEDYGRLYNWYAIKDSRNIAPTGWHVPSDEEWKQLEMYLGMSRYEADISDRYRGTNEGGKLKETGTALWNSPNTGATNESGFSALPGGCRYGHDYYDYVGTYAIFWTSSEYNYYEAGYRTLCFTSSQVYRNGNFKRTGYSIRCVKTEDENTPPSASFTVSHTFGVPQTDIHFNASGSSDNEDPTSSLLVRWDWENDGSWDTNYSTNKIATHQYYTEGAKNIKLEVKDTGGLTNSTIFKIFITYETSETGETGTLTDIDANTYRTIKIGNQWWMAENLKVTHYRNGDPIPQVTDYSEW